MNKTARAAIIAAIWAPVWIAASPAAAQENPDELLWGDTHLHTLLSFDAYALGNRSVDADTAYRFAKGIPAIHPYHRARVQLETPLDFLAVTDHAELLGMVYSLIGERDPRLTETTLGKRFLELFEAGREREAFSLIVLGGNLVDMPDEDRPPKIGPLTFLRWKFEDLFLSPEDRTKANRARAERWLASDPDIVRELDNDEISADMWARNMDAATLHNEPGKFTTLVGWEFSSTPDGANLHRIVLSPMDPQDAKKISPYSTIDSSAPEDLWRWLAETKAETGADFTAIPHNSNISKGRMYAPLDHQGRPMDDDYANLRSTWETVAEVTQIKGTSETHPALSPNDEFASFEFYGSLINMRSGNAQTAEAAPADYVRSALKSGLELERQLGVNPFKLGMIGSTDTHTGLPSAEENNFMGKFATDSTPETKEVAGGLGSGWNMSASGLAAVWARENTREEIFAAFKRREVYGTTGPRLAVRFFGGYGFDAADLDAANLADVGYAKGVPMGGDMTGADGQAPSFLIHAVKDPKGANLDRVQVIKGWLDSQGSAHEKVFDVAWSGERQRGADGKIPAISGTVDIPTASYTNAIGAPELATVWSDPEFDPDASAFYYARVLQIPTPRNSTYDAAALKSAPPEGHDAAIQERAYTSPIWYSPTEGGR
jgi:hypothetical protein